MQHLDFLPLFKKTCETLDKLVQPLLMLLGIIISFFIFRNYLHFLCFSLDFKRFILHSGVFCFVTRAVWTNFWWCWHTGTIGDTLGLVNLLFMLLEMQMNWRSSCLLDIRCGFVTRAACTNLWWCWHTGCKIQHQKLSTTACATWMYTI